MIWLVLSLVALVLAAIPAVLFVRNLQCYLPPAERRIDMPPTAVPPLVSILIPARNEAAAIDACVAAAAASQGVDCEVLVLDDHSTDDTAERVRQWAQRDRRVRLEVSPLLPPGWCGKQHACHVLAERATHSWLLFVDADVRLAPDGAARLVQFAQDSGAALVSGFPRQQTVGFAERSVIPLVHFILLGFLPVERMRASTAPAYGAGCGQLFLATRSGYRLAGGHAAIRASRHDGLTLPRAFRAAGLRTDLCDATLLATCRMYRSAGELWQGLAKNATEGLAKPALIVPATVMLLGGQVLPVCLLVASLAGWLPRGGVLWASAAGTVLSYLPRGLGACRFRQSWVGVAAHPLGVFVLLAIQWWAFGRWLAGKEATWKGRSYNG